jgi:hypothetical protein
MRRIASLLAAALVATAIGVLAPASPASATDVCAGLNGTALLNTGLLYPVTVVPDANTATLSVNVLQATTTNFTVNFGTGVGTCAIGGPLTAGGTVSGWCGLSSGSGATNDGFRFAWIGIGGTLILTGGLVGVVNAIPDVPGGQSCNQNKGGGATRFIVTGLALKAHCAVKSKSLTTVAIPPTLVTPVAGPPLTVNVHTGTWHVWTKVCVASAQL